LALANKFRARVTLAIRNAGKILASFGLMLACTLVSHGQTPTGQMTGAIKDASGAVVPAATVVVANVDTGVQRTTTSNEEGYYTVPLLPPGNYRIMVRKGGFKPVTKSGLTLAVDQVARIDFTVEVGSITDTIDVMATAPVVEQETAAMGTVVDNRKITNLPLNTRDPYRLTFLMAGVVPGGTFSDAYNDTADFMVNGGRANLNEIFIDGVSAMITAAGNFGLSPGVPSPDALQEFKVQTNNYSAEYGRSGGGVVNMVMKSGTNGFHGTAYEFLRNSTMDANNFFANRTGARLASFKRNQFGGTLGGPIIRNKAFFFVNYEGLRQRAANNLTATVPTLLERKGDFSKSFQLVGGACVPVQIFSPATTRANPQGGFIRDQFPNNMIPAQSLDKVGLAMASFYPLPTSAGDPCTGANNFFSAKSDTFTSDQMDAKLDWAQSERNRFVADLSWRGPFTLPANQFGNVAYGGGGSTPAGAYNNGQYAPTRMLRVDFTRVMTPTLVFDFRFGLVRQEVSRSPYPPDFSMTDLGFSQSLQNQLPQPIAFPGVTVAGYPALGNGGEAILSETANSYSLNGSTTWVKGRHTLKFGTDIRRLMHLENNNFSLGTYSFNAGFTQGPDPNSPRADRGSSIASVLLGLGTGYTEVRPALVNTNYYFGLYLQDDFKVTSKLTLNLGIRYDLETGRQDRFNQLSWFDFTAPSPLSGQVPGLSNLRGGLRFTAPGQAAYDTDPNNFGPRVGFAYSVSSKTVLRGGYGIFYLPFVGAANVPSTPGYTSHTDWISSLDGLTPYNYLSNAYPNGLTPASGSSLGLNTFLGTNITAYDRTSRVGYMQQWNFNVQRQLPSRFVIEAAYVGNKGTKLTDTQWQANQLPTADLALGSSLQRLVANPFYGIITSGPLAQPTVAYGQLLRPYPQFLNVTDSSPTAASSSYHALEMRLQREFTRDLSVLVSYTASKLIDDSSGAESHGAYVRPLHEDAYNRRLDRSVSAQDVSQRLVLSYVYGLPLGRNRAFGSSWPGWVEAAFGNWQINGITTFSTGFPLALTASNNSGIFSDVQRPNVNGDPNLGGGRTTQARLARWFDTSVFTQPPAFTLGNTSRTLPNVRTDGIRNFDFSIFKDFPFRVFGEEQRLQFRGELFNLFNTPQFGVPGTVLGTASFGVVSSQLNIPRQVQLALKLIF